MKSILNLIIAIPTLLLSTSCDGQIKNAKTVTVKIDGNCEMCEKTIESAANQKKVVSLDWNKDTKQATISYDDSKTNPDEILKRVALAGYDNEKFLAPGDAYAGLPGCCKYDRNRKKSEIEKTITATTDTTAIVQSVVSNQFKAIFDSYFELKNALVKTDAKTAGLKATDLTIQLNKVDMSILENSQHVVWMKVYKNLIAKSELIATAKNIENQRTQFMDVSESMYKLLKVAKLATPVYYQHCPMYNDGKGANWLSMENAVKNPYYGSQMLSCGKTIETIK
ncbi:MAG: DUF3347 domain-containing protein [Bacteroidota bacterium]|nr:DUF3347 domain-containing protein [Bacteroidota bacterium]MDP3145952.1 DUF3347 domain-containing protein [Bacteroidota bacterium]MDP3558587.1 DUF3347 domain-containing protein [Bacteroidota bacterium]